MRKWDNKQPLAAPKRPRRIPIPSTAPSLISRLKLRDAFFSNQINLRQPLHAFDQMPAFRYFVKDTESRLMALSDKRVSQLGLTSEDEVIGMTDRDYLPSEIVDQFLADDQWVIRHGNPLRNRVEMGMDENGFRD